MEYNKILYFIIISYNIHISVINRLPWGCYTNMYTSQDSCNRGFSHNMSTNHILNYAIGIEIGY